MFGFGKNKDNKKDKTDMDKFQADYVHALIYLSYDTQQVNYIIEQYPMIQDIERIKDNIAELQRCAVFLFIRMAHGDSDWARLVNERIDNESKTWIHYKNYVDVLEGYLQLPGRTALSDNFVEDVGRVFQKLCGEKAMASCDRLAELGCVVYKNTYTSCLNWLAKYQI
ncbi:hypothetical protein [Candidatus Bathycorpusculum sp.]|uniref:hypothetical protein n=1 Tax=Candidatus Bathycorpusculum sp. TaxID=2994959 RepID=UPI00282FA314|nr:hypothetical protein [Candidatus Termitimicrobium sp.]MCL2686382.1 hypothetical protein [Candidatus Termitimicrobium sp.]